MRRTNEIPATTAGKSIFAMGHSINFRGACRSMAHWPKSLDTAKSGTEASSTLSALSGSSKLLR